VTPPTAVPMRPTLATAFAFVFLLFFTSFAAGQSFLPRTSLEGIVTDLTGDTLPGVSVVITDEDTGFERFTITNGAGLFRALVLPQGRYRVLVQLLGFKQLAITGVTTALARPTIVDAALSVGDFNQLETRRFDASVRSRAAQLDAGVEFTRGELAVLPLPTRNPADVALFDSRISGAAVVGSPEPLLNVNGLRYRSQFRLDGLGGSSATLGFGLLVPLPEIAIDAAALSTDGYAAEYGQTTGLLFNAVTPDGGVRPSGGVRYLFRRDTFSAHEPSIDDDSTAQTPAQLDDVAATIGGPASIAGMRYFGGYQRLARDLRFNPTSEPQFRGSSTTSSVLAKASFWVGPANRITVRHLNVQGDASPNGPASSTPWLDDSSHSTAFAVTTLIGGRRLNDFRVQFASNSRGLTGPARMLEQAPPSAIAPFLGERVFEIAEGFTFIRNSHTYSVGLNEQWLHSDPPDASGEPVFRSRLHAYYVEDDWRVNAAVRLQYGIRYDSSVLPTGYDVADSNNLGPRFALSWSPSHRTVMRASTGITSDDPMLGLLGRVALDPALEFASSWQNAVQIEQAIGKQYAADVTYVFARHRHLPVLSSSGSVDGIDPALLTLQSTGSAHYSGLSIRFTRRFVDSLGFSVAYTAAGPAAPLLAAQTVVGTLTYVLPSRRAASFQDLLLGGHEFGMVVRTASGVLANPQDSRRLQGTSNVDVRYAKRIALGGSWSADFIAELANVFNTDQRFTVPPVVPVESATSPAVAADFITRTAPPRQLQLGLRLRF